MTVSGLLGHLGVKAQRVAVEVNDTVVTKDRYESQRIGPGDSIEIVAFVGGGSDGGHLEHRPAHVHEPAARRNGRIRTSRPCSRRSSRRAPRSSRSPSGAWISSKTGEASLLEWIPKAMKLLPNTAACFTADEAIRTARLGRELEEIS